MKARESLIPWTQLRPALARLEAAARSSDVAAILDILSELVSEYRPSGEIVDWISRATAAQPAGWR
jgi:hypothetical protein